ncbi:MAG: glucosamine-6-phosphate deaminase [Salinivirgaceae bacterium]|jgi:glucosamine-6-phosphate deaminase|nr:glucosamine-6-phosphate deaminase [Salinivirgaceae bacterium]
MRLIIQQDYKKASKWTANYIARRILKYKPTSDNPFIMGLPTGSSPIQLYKDLVELHKKGVISFKNVVTFNMDEYIGIPEDHPQSYHSFMNNHFFSHIDIPKENTNILNGNASDLIQECANYEAKIKLYGGIHLFLGGIGPDGHLAFNEPGSSLASRTRIKTLTEDTKIANSRFFDGDTSKVPSTALTVGVGTILDAKEIVIIASGNSKAAAIKQAIERGVNHMWTVSALQLHAKSIVICDEEAIYDIKYSTVKYFKDIESKNLNPDNLLKI